MKHFCQFSSACRCRVLASNLCSQSWVGGQRRRVEWRRDPAFCGAERAAWWELVPLAAHAHPSVAAMTRTLLAGTTIVYEGDPLRSLTLGAFLDKFVQKKPKV